jgi:hypothetical protein
MAQQRITFEWILEEEPRDSWKNGEDFPLTSSLALSPGERVVVNRLVRGLSLLLMVVCAAAGTALTPAEQARQQAQTGIDFALHQENLAWRAQDRTLYASLVDPMVGREWREEWQEATRAEDQDSPAYRADLLYVRPADGVDGLMQALVHAELPSVEWWQTNPYRENRFYRQVGQGWVRTLPPAGFWGRFQRYETPHLRFTFYARDAAVVKQAAAQLETAYVEMYTLLGLKPPTGHDKLTVDVVARPVGRWAPSPTELEVVSPLLAAVPVGQSDADYLAYEAMGWFTYRVLREAAPGLAGRYLYRWPIVVWGLRGWMRDDLLPHTSPWQEDAQRIFWEDGQDDLPLRLATISQLQGQGRPSRSEVIVRYMAAESFIRFVVDTYGRERLPELIDGLVRYGSWETMIPALYGHSVEKFVADWNLYVMEHYAPASE